MEEAAVGMQSYVSIDLETTGLNPKTDKIIEIGAVKIEQGEVKETFSSFVHPGRRLEERIVELTGIRDEELADAPVIDEVFPELQKFLGELPLLGHSILFDYSFLKKAAVNLGQKFDTLKLARKYLPDLESRRLDFLCEYYQIPHHAHRALADAEATDRLYRCLREHFYVPEEGLFQPAPLIYNVKKDQPASKLQKEKLYRLREQHKLIMDVEIERLTRSEASRLTDKILMQIRGVRNNSSGDALQ